MFSAALSLPPTPPASWSPRRGVGCLLQAGIAAAPVEVSAPPPRFASPPPRPITACRRAPAASRKEGSAIWSQGPGDCRSLGLGPVAMGAAPRILLARGHWSVVWRATGQPCVLCMSELELL